MFPNVVILCPPFSSELEILHCNFINFEANLKFMQKQKNMAARTFTSENENKVRICISFAHCVFFLFVFFVSDTLVQLHTERPFFLFLFFYICYWKCCLKTLFTCLQLQLNMFVWVNSGSC